MKCLERMFRPQKCMDFITAISVFRMCWNDRDFVPSVHGFNDRVINDILSRGRRVEDCASKKPSVQQ